MKLLSVLSILIVTGIMACSTSAPRGPIVKVWVSKPDRGGLVRSQDNQIIKYEDSLNYRCMSKKDFDDLLNYCFNPDRDIQSLKAKINSLPPRHRERALRSLVWNLNAIIENNI